MAEIKNGFFDFIAQVFDSWAEFLRPQIEEELPVPPVKDPFVSAPPEQWLELTSGLSFTEWGRDESGERDEPGEAETSVLPPPAETAETAETTKSVINDKAKLSEAARPDLPPNLSPPKKSAWPEGPAFIEKRLATPEEVEFVERKIRQAEASASFISFSENKNTSERTAKFVPARGNPERTPARFFPAGVASGKSEEKFVPASRHSANLAESSFTDINAPKGPDTQNPANAIPKRGTPEAESSFVTKETGMQSAPAVFAEPRISPVPVEATSMAFAKAGVSGSQVLESGKFVDSPTTSFPQNPAEFPRRVVSALADLSGMKENVFFPIPARKEPARDLLPGKKLQVINGAPENDFPGPSKWAELPELDLNGGAAKAGETPDTDHLRLRHLASLEREQKGERWSV